MAVGDLRAACRAVEQDARPPEPRVLIVMPLHLHCLILTQPQRHLRATSLHQQVEIRMAQVVIGHVRRCHAPTAALTERRHAVGGIGILPLDHHPAAVRAKGRALPIACRLRPKGHDLAEHREQLRPRCHTPHIHSFKQMRQRLRIHRQRCAGVLGGGALKHRPKHQILKGRVLCIERVFLHEVAPPALKMLFFVPIDLS